MLKELERYVYCPWCNKGEVVTEGAVTGSLTVKCPKCQHVFRIHLDTLTTEKAIARNRSIKASFRLKPTSTRVSSQPHTTVTD